MPDLLDRLKTALADRYTLQLASDKWVKSATGGPRGAGERTTGRPVIERPVGVSLARHAPCAGAATRRLARAPR